MNTEMIFAGTTVALTTWLGVFFWGTIHIPHIRVVGTGTNVPRRIFVATVAALVFGFFALVTTMAIQKWPS